MALSRVAREFVSPIEESDVSPEGARAGWGFLRYDFRVREACPSTIGASSLPLGVVSSLGDTTSTMSPCSVVSSLLGVDGTACSEEAVEVVEGGRERLDFDMSAMGETDCRLRGTTLLTLASDSYSGFRWNGSEGEREEIEDIESRCNCELRSFITSAQSSRLLMFGGGVTLDLPLLLDVIKEDEFSMSGRGAVLGVVGGGILGDGVLAKDNKEDCKLRVFSSRPPLDFSSCRRSSFCGSSTGDSGGAIASRGIKLSRGLRKVGRGGGVYGIPEWSYRGSELRLKSGSSVLCTGLVTALWVSCGMDGGVELGSFGRPHDESIAFARQLLLSFANVAIVSESFSFSV